MASTSDAGRQKRAQRRETRKQKPALQFRENREESGKTTRAQGWRQNPKTHVSNPSSRAKIHVEEIERRIARDGKNVKGERKEKKTTRNSRTNTRAEVMSMPISSTIAQLTRAAHAASVITPAAGASPVMKKRKRCSDFGKSVVSQLSASDSARELKLNKAIRFSTSNDVHFSPSPPLKTRARASSSRNDTKRLRVTSSSMKATAKKARVQKREALETECEAPEPKRKAVDTLTSHRENETTTARKAKTNVEKKAKETKKKKKKKKKVENKKVVKKIGEVLTPIATATECTTVIDSRTSHACLMNWCHEIVPGSVSTSCARTRPPTACDMYLVDVSHVHVMRVFRKLLA